MIKSTGKKHREPHRNRREELLRRLGLTPEQVARSPQITRIILNQFGILPERVIEVLRADVEVESIKVVQLWDKMTPANRNYLGMEGLALGTGISPRRMWELYCGANLMQACGSVNVATVADALPAPDETAVVDQPDADHSRQELNRLLWGSKSPKRHHQ